MGQGKNFTIIMRALSFLFLLLLLIFLLLLLFLLLLILFPLLLTIIRKVGVNSSPCEKGLWARENLVPLLQLHFLAAGESSIIFTLPMVVLG